MNIDHAFVDYIILADHAEAVNGKLYLMGGNWNHIQIANYAQPIQVHAAMCVSIPWGKSNNKLPMKVTIVNTDGQDVFPPFRTNIIAGRPPNAVYGQNISMTIALNMLTVIPQRGTYAVVAEITDDGEEWRTTRQFYVYAQGEEPV